MKSILKIEKVYSLSGSLHQTRIKIFGKVVFTKSFKHHLNTI